MVFIRKDYIQDNQDWEEQNQRVISLLNIARISILFSLLIFLSIIHNLGNTSSTATYIHGTNENGMTNLVYCL